LLFWASNDRASNDKLRHPGIDASLTQLETMNIKEAAEHLGISVKTLERKIAASEGKEEGR
jgi:transposase